MTGSLTKWKNSSFELKLVYFCTVAAFLPYYITAVVVIAAAFVILINPRLRSMIFAYKGSKMLFAFTLFSVMVSVSYSNLFGAFAAVGFFLIMCIGLLSRAVMTKRAFARILHICSLMSLTVTGSLIIEKAVYANAPYYRCCSYFLNSNYVATILAFTIIMCAYRVISKTGAKFFYYAVAVCDAIGIYLTGSLFAWVCVFIGVSLLLLLSQEHHLLSIFLLVVAFFGLLIAFIPDFLPRISEVEVTTDNRRVIWHNAIKGIKENFLTGQGFLSYLNIYGTKEFSPFTIAHAHNIILDTLLNHGIIGTVLLLWYFLSYYFKVRVLQRNMESNSPCVLIIAMTAAVIFHSMVDMTILWIQTALVAVIIMGGIGVDEAKLTDIPTVQEENKD